jgi:hypothetical protein
MSERSWRNRLIMGSALGAAAIAVAIDHTRHPLPAPVAVSASQQGAAVVIVEEGDNADQGASPCALGDSPCALGDSPCALDTSPCSL